MWVDKRLRYILVMAAVLTLVSCGDEQVPHDPYSLACDQYGLYGSEPYVEAAQIDSLVDLRYGIAADWQGQALDLTLDAYFPSLSDDEVCLRPAVIIIHGGGYQNGSKEQWRDECLAFAQRGFVAFTINYRLGFDESDELGLFKAAYRAHQDALAATRYIQENATTFGVDTNQLFIGGGSAGSNCAMNVVYASEREWEDLYPGIVQELGLLHSSGNGLVHRPSFQGLFNNWGAVAEYFVQPEEMIPMVSFHAVLDHVVNIDVDDNGWMGSRALSKRLQKSGVCFDLTVEPSSDHGIYRNDGGVNFRAARASCFFKRVMCGACQESFQDGVVMPEC